MKRRWLMILTLLVGLDSFAARHTWAQEPAKPAEATKPADRPADTKARQRAATLLRIQLAIARYQGEKRVSNVPYTVTTGTSGMVAKLRMGVEVPVPITAGDKTAPASYQYRTVGTNIDCMAEDVGDGLFALRLNVENSSVYSTPDGRSPNSPSEMSMTLDKPLFRTFNVSLNPTLRDGQTLQTVASTDPVTGEVVKIDVSLNVVR